MTKILLVDDDKAVVETVKFLLQTEGYSVVTASDGEEGLEKAKKERPDLILLDILMPKVNGFSACRAIKSDETLKGSYVIMLTGKGQEVDKEMGYKEGADEFLTKPFSPMEIVAKVRRILGTS